MTTTTITTNRDLDKIIEQSKNRERWLDYLDQRVGTYEWRTLRFAEVYDELLKTGLDPTRDLIADVGAGMCDFARYIYQTRNFQGRYLPVDGSIDGARLEDWDPVLAFNAIVCIETVEHLRTAHAIRLMETMKDASWRVVLTTPNPEVWIPEVGSVENLDPTHHSSWDEFELQELGFTTRTHSLFGKPNDTIIATWRR